MTYVSWRSPVTAENGGGYAFPQKFTSYFRAKYSCPAVYRWRIHPGAAIGKREDVYIGEAEDLVSRVQRVLTPSRSSKGGETNRRLNKIFLDAIASERKVFLDIADFQPFEIDGVVFSPEKLSDPFRRAVLENIFLLHAQQEGWGVLNKTVNLAEKQAVRYFMKLPAHRRKELINSVLKKKQGEPL